MKTLNLVVFSAAESKETTQARCSSDNLSKKTLYLVVRGK